MNLSRAVVVWLATCCITVYSQPGNGRIGKELPDPAPPNDDAVEVEPGGITGQSAINFNKFSIEHAHEQEKKPHDSKKEEQLIEEQLEKLQKEDNKEAKENGEKNKRQKRSFILNTKKWPKCIIPYTYDSTYNDRPGEIQSIEKGINKYRKYTGFRFVNYTGNNSIYGLDHDYRLVFTAESGCWSYVGNTMNQNGQLLGACSGDTTIHELGHALGLMHEHQHPMSMDWLRVNFHEVKKDKKKWYFRNALSNVANKNKDFYDVSSIMHYPNWLFSLNDEATMSFYDEDDEFHMNHFNSFYYMFRDLQIYHNCFKEYDSCATPPTCANGGYVSVIDGKCGCMCPEGLDMATNCTTELQTKGAKWPKGTYTVLKTTKGDCPSGWKPGTMVQKNAWWTWSGMTYHSQPYSLNRVAHDTCTKTDANAGSDEWPAGVYCILRYGQKCPAGFTDGTLKTYGEKKPANDPAYMNIGTLPDGRKHRNFEYIFCCRSDGSEDTDLEGVEITTPVILFPMSWSCQSIKNTVNTREFINWRNNDEKNITMTGSLPKIWSFSNKLINIYYCAYFPMPRGKCGEIKKFSASETTHTFSTPNFPTAVPSGIECFWRYESPEGTIMQLDFQAFDLPAEDGRCVTYLEIREWFPATKGLKICGSGYQKTTWTKENYLTLKLVTFASRNGKGFNATIKILPRKNPCYTGDGSNGVYAGTVNYGKNFAPCIPWDEVQHCAFHQFDPRTVSEDMTGHNYCRNPGMGKSPWCYRDKDCRMQMCDVCQLGNCYDLFSDCQALINANSNYCSDNVLGEAARGCRATCNLCARPYRDENYCIPPQPVQGISSDTTETAFRTGDTVTYTCPKTQVKQTRTCTSEGQWTELNVVCGVCPAGWAVFQKKCYKWLGYTTQLSYSAAKSRCQQEANGARIPKITNHELELFIQSIVDYFKEDPADTWIAVIKNSNGKWVTDGTNTEPSYTHWASKYPWGSHDCSTLSKHWVGNIFDTAWWSTYCSNERTVVCELELTDANNKNSCKDQRKDCITTLMKWPDMCTRYPEYAWQNCRLTCGIDACNSTLITCADETNMGTSGTRVYGKNILQVGDYVEYKCSNGLYLKSGDLKRACTPSGKLTGHAPVCSADVDKVSINDNVVLKRRRNTYDKTRIVTANNNYMKVSVPGQIRTWRFYSNLKGEAAFVILRPTLAIEPPYSQESFSVVGINKVPVTDDNRAMEVHIPEANRVAVQAGDFIGIYHRNDELSYSGCNEGVSPNESGWMRSGVYADVSSLPAVGATVKFSEDRNDNGFHECRLYSLQYDVDTN